MCIVCFGQKDLIKCVAWHSILPRVLVEALIGKFVLLEGIADQLEISAIRLKADRSLHVQRAIFPLILVSKCRARTNVRCPGIQEFCFSSLWTWKLWDDSLQSNYCQNCWPVRQDGKMRKGNLQGSSRLWGAKDSSDPSPVCSICLCCQVLQIRKPILVESTLLFQLIVWQIRSNFRILPTCREVKTSAGAERFQDLRDSAISLQYAVGRTNMKTRQGSKRHREDDDSETVSSK